MFSLVSHLAFKKLTGKDRGQPHVSPAGKKLLLFVGDSLSVV